MPPSAADSTPAPIRDITFAMKPIWAKLTFWRRLSGYHPAIRGAALATAFRSGGVFSRHAGDAAAPAGSSHREGMATTAHPFWAETFESERLIVREMLEIGAFEGRTTAFAAKLFPNARITCVDPWAEYCEMRDLSRAERAFGRNTAAFGERIRALKGFSAELLPQLLREGEKFDVIFVDGSHAYDDVVVDTQHAWALLNPGGVLIWDDYLWRRPGYGRNVPKRAIDEFLSDHRGAFTPLWAFKQVAIRKSA